MATNEQVAQWLADHPTASDAEITAAANIAGVSAAQLAAVTGLSESNVISRMMDATPAATALVSQARATENPLAYVNQVTALPDTITDYRGKTYSTDTLKSLAGQLAAISDPAHLSGGAFGEKEGNIGFAYKDLAGALGANPTTFDQVLMDAARGLVDRGITDINQIKPPEGAAADYTGAGKGAGETYTGPGKTSYAVDFINGKPYFNVTGDSTSFFNSDLGKAAMVAGAYFGAPYISSAIGGATGLTGAGLAGATGAAIGGTGAALTGGDVLKGALLGGAVGYGTGMLSGSQASAADAMAADNIDVGGGWNPAGGTNGVPYADPATAAAAAETGVTSSALTPHYGLPTTTGGSLTASQVIKALPLVPIVNQVLGDPLGVNQTQQSGGGGGGGGYSVVPIPSTWKSPTYQNISNVPGVASTGSFTPIDLNSIFTNQNLLAGTQWEGLPSQKNLTFNDIFASGQQLTPMGTPVNINNIVSAILGQTATSQKSA